MTLEPTPAQLAIAKRVGNRLSEKMPRQGVMDFTDVQQFALEALLGLIRDGKAPDEPAHLSVSVRTKTIDLLREHGVLHRATDGSYSQVEAPTLDALPPHIRDAIEHQERLEELGELDVAALDREERKRARATINNRHRRRRWKHVTDLVSLGRQQLMGGLTERELESLAGRADGHTQIEIGEALGISADTVTQHLNRAYKKLSAHNGAHAVAIAFRRGLLA